MTKKKFAPWLALLLTMALIFSFAACNKKEEEDPDASTTAATLDGITSDSDAEPANADIGYWSIEIRGVEKVTTFSSEDAKHLPQVTMNMTTTSSGGFTVENSFTGITLRSLLQCIGVINVSNVSVVAIDGSAVNYPTDIAMAEDTMLAWAKNGVPIESDPPLHMCTNTGGEDMYVRLVGTLNISPLNEAYTTTLPFQDLTTDYTYPTYSYATYSYPTYSYTTYSYPTHSYDYNTTLPTTSATSSGTGSSAESSTESTTASTTATTTTTTTTTTTRTTHSRYSYDGPTSTARPSSKEAPSTEPRPDNWPSDLPWPV